jgi:murein DD-endopeptidase MepM/ murein hydrolase activator NlpD
VPNPVGMTRRTVLALLLLCTFAATPALGDDIAKKQQVDQQIQANQAKLAATRANEDRLRNQIAELDNRIGGLETQVGSVSQQLATLQQDLAYRRQRLADLTALYKLETRRLNQLKAQYKRAVGILNRRLVAIYESPQQSSIDFVLGASSIDDMLDELNFIKLIGKEDRQIADQVKRAKIDMRAHQLHTKRLRLKVLGDERALAVRAAQAQDARDALIGARDQLAQSKQQQSVDLGKLSAQDRALADEIGQEQAASAQLQAAILAAQQHSSVTATPSSAGLIWPVSGPITSPFGMRWGRLHAGIDIGVPYGTPIQAAASGTVIYCGWESGYGNLVVLDNGGNLATAYAHQSQIAVSCGQHVDQGQTIGYVGCTGHCFGPHLHFEVRIDGAPVDPLGYL